jgi:CHAT domain-containing protein
MDRITEIHTFLEASQIEPVIEELLEFSKLQDDHRLQNKLKVLNFRFTEANRNEQSSLTFFKKALQDQIQIVQSLQDIIEEIKKQETINPVNQPTQKDVILFLASAPYDLAKLQLEKEFVRISQSLQDGKVDYSLKVELAIKREELQTAVLKHQPRIVHFSGHGIDANSNNITGGIFLQDDKGEAVLVSGEALAGMFGVLLRKIDIEVVLLNSCYSEEQAKTIAEHVPYVIGINDSVKDGVAIEFAAGFYRSMSQYRDEIDFAFDLAKNQIQLTGLPQEDAPVMFKKQG